MTAALEAFAAFFGIDPDLVQVAAERPAIVIPSASTSADVGKILSAMTDSEKTEILARLYDGDIHVAVELRAKVRDRMAAVEADAAGCRPDRRRTPCPRPCAGDSGTTCPQEAARRAAREDRIAGHAAAYSWRRRSPTN
jgi:hypothetical protein